MPVYFNTVVPISPKFEYANGGLVRGGSECLGFTVFAAL